LPAAETQEPGRLQKVSDTKGLGLIKIYPVAIFLRYCSVERERERERDRNWRYCGNRISRPHGICDEGLSNVKTTYSRTTTFRSEIRTHSLNALTSIVRHSTKTSVSINCFIVLHLLFLTELQTRVCAEGLAEQIQLPAINISQTVTHIQDLAVQFSPTITKCVTSNIAKPIAIPGCLSKIIGPVISAVGIHYCHSAQERLPKI